VLCFLSMRAVAFSFGSYGRNSFFMRNKKIDASLKPLSFSVNLPCRGDFWGTSNGFCRYTVTSGGFCNVPSRVCASALREGTTGVCYRGIRHSPYISQAILPRLTAHLSSFTFTSLRICAASSLISVKSLCISLQPYHIA
jgi:hypothetical protein